MKDYSLYGVEDFVTDESYLRYYFRENEADIQFWTEWIGLHPEKLDIVISANNYIDAFSVRLSETEFQKEQQRFAQSLNNLSLNDDLYGNNENQEIPAMENRYARTLSSSVTGIAACLLVLVCSVIYIVFHHTKTATAPALANVVMREKYVPKGGRASITLPDGSEVVLNADSRLVYPSTFTGTAREVQLTGEAFFRVKTDSLRPFRVLTANLVTTVLGTSFNMQCYPDKNQAKVALVTGKVRLDRISDPVHKQVLGEALVLTPAEMGVFDKHDLSLEKTKYDPDEETGWQQGIVVFRDADFAEIASRLDKVYNTRLINRSAKTTFRFKGTFTNASAEEIVKSICLSKKLSYTTNGNVITIQ